MTKEDARDESELTPEELAEQTAHAIPDRVAMVTVDTSVAIPIDPAIAADVLAGELGAEGEPVDEAAERGGGEHG